jgi:hypothetical protein
MDQTFGLIFGGVLLVAMVAWWIVLRIQGVGTDQRHDGGSDGSITGSRSGAGGSDGGPSGGGGAGE